MQYGHYLGICGTVSASRMKMTCHSLARPSCDAHDSPDAEGANLLLNHRYAHWPETQASAYDIRMMQGQWNGSTIGSSTWTNLKSRAKAQQIVTTRLLYYLHHPGSLPVVCKGR